MLQFEGFYLSDVCKLVLKHSLTDLDQIILVQYSMLY